MDALAARVPIPLSACGDINIFCARVQARISAGSVATAPGLIARDTKPFALLVAHLAYEAKEGPRLAYRFERFEK